MNLKVKKHFSIIENCPALKTAPKAMLDLVFITYIWKRICATPLSKDLSSAIGEPVILFHVSGIPWVQQIDSKGRRGYVTDGPWMHRLPSGELLMLWSSFSKGGYTVGVARSTSGQLLGSWQRDAQPLYSGDGGHCMAFRDFDGNLWLSIHHPNETPHERPIFLPLEEDKLVTDRD